MLRLGSILALIAAVTTSAAPARAANGGGIALGGDATGADLLAALRTWLTAHGGRDRCSLLVGDGLPAAPTVSIAAGDTKLALPYACGALPALFAGRTPFLEEVWFDPSERPRPGVRVRRFSGVGMVTEGSAALTGLPKSALLLLERLTQLRGQAGEGPIAVDVALRVAPAEDPFFAPPVAEYRRVVGAADPAACFGTATPKGAVTFAVVLDAKRKPSRVALVASSLTDDKVLACLTKLVHGLAFGPDVSWSNLSLPITFSH